MFGLGVKEHPTLPAWRDGFDTRRPNQSECGVTVAHGPSKPRGTGSNPVIRSTPSVVSMQHAEPLTREVVVRVHPEGPDDYVAQRQRRQVESLSSGGSNPPMVTRPARGAIGRRGTLRPCRSGFESPRADHSGGDIVEGKDAALSAREYGFESR